MNLKNTLLMAALSLIVSAITVQAMPGPGSQPAYSIVDLGTLGGDTYASAINSTGEVAGTSNLPNGYSRAFLYEKGVMHDIGFLGTNKSDQSYAYAINASGVVVGYSYIDSEHVHAFLFNGQMHDLGNLGGGEGEALGINDLGQVVGNSTIANGGWDHAFIYNAGKMTDLGVFRGQFDPNSSALGINKIGEAVGYSTYNINREGYHAFLYANAHMYDLGINPAFGSLDSSATANNDHDQIVGYAKEYAGSEFEGAIVFGFIYSAGVVTKISNIVPGDLNTPNIPDGVIPEAINNGGVVVGTDPSVPGRESGSGFIYQGGVTLDANSLVPANSGWVIGECTGINDSSQICGNGLHNGLQRAFVMTPVGSPLLP